MSLLTLWYAGQGGQIETDDALSLAVRAELLGALSVVRALNNAVRQTADHAFTKDLLLEMLGHLETSILTALEEVASGTWPYVSVYDAFRFRRGEEKAEAAEAQASETSA